MWHEIAISTDFYIGIRGKASLFKTPKSYGNYTFFHPSSLVTMADTFCILAYSDDWTWQLSRPDYDHYGRISGYTKTPVGPEEFTEIWPNATNYVHHIPPRLAPEKTEALEELLDED